VPQSTLVEFRRGDGPAFVEVMRAYAPLVRSVVARHFNAAFDREEAIQEVWLHVFRNREALDLGRAESFSGWLAVLATRRCVDLLRQSPGKAAPLPDEDESRPPLWADRAEDQPATTVEEAELMRAVAAFKAKLKPAWREFFELHFVEGLDYAAVATRLRISKLRCKYMRKVLAMRARRNREVMAALGRALEGRGAGAS